MSLAARVLLALLAAGCHRAPTVVELSVHQPGAPATAIEERVASVEKAVGQVSRLIGTESRSRAGFASLRVSFAPGTDVWQARSELMAKLDQMPSIPNLTVVTHAPRQARPIRFAIESGQLTSSQLRQLAEMLRANLLTVEGVTEVNLCGGFVDEVEVRVDVERSEAMGIGVLDIAHAFPRITVERALGNKPDVVVRAQGPSLDELRAAVIVERSGAQVRLSDVATVSVFGAPTGCEALLDGRRVVAGEVMISPTAKRAEMTELTAAKLRATKPPSAKVTLLEDDLATLRLRVPVARGELGRALATAVGIKAAVRGARQALVELGDEDSDSPTDGRVHVAAEPQVMDVIATQLRKTPSVTVLDAEAGERPHHVTITGPDRDQLRRLVRPLADHRDLFSEGLVDSTPEPTPEIDEAAAAKLGAVVSDIKEIYRYVGDGAVVATQPFEKGFRSVVLRLGQQTPIFKLSVRGTDGARVPLSLVLKTVSVNRPTLLLRERGQPAVRLGWYGSERPKLPSLPPGYSARWSD